MIHLLPWAMGLPQTNPPLSAPSFSVSFQDHPSLLTLHPHKVNLGDGRSKEVKPTSPEPLITKETESTQSKTHSLLGVVVRVF